MANRRGLGVSKKYAKGTIHETATGRFVVLDRFAEEDDDKNIPILEFQWLSGEKEGKIETNREMNMAANIHKFQTSRGRPTIQFEPKTIEDDITFVEKIDKTFEILNDLTLHLSRDEIKIEKINKTLDEVNGIKQYIDKAANTVINSNTEFVGKINQIFEIQTNNRDYINKVTSMIDNLHITVIKQQEAISHLTEQINTLMSGNTLVKQQQETLQIQQTVISKLIEKIK